MRLIPALLVAGLVGITAAFVVGHVTSSAARVPTIVVARETFRHRVTADGALRATTSTPITVPKAVGLGYQRVLSWIAPDGSAVAAGEVVARFDRTAMEKQLHDAEAELVIADAHLVQERLRSTESARAATATVVRAEQDLVQATRFAAKDPMLYTRRQIIVGELDAGLLAERVTQAKRARTTDAVVTRANLALSQLARERLIRTRDQARAALATTEVKAPHGGIVVVERDPTGQPFKGPSTVWEDQVLAKLPQPAVMEAELFVLEVDGVGLADGQPVEIVVVSRPDEVVKGIIASIDKLAKPRDPSSTVNYIAVVVALDHTDPVVMKPGQRARATIVLGETPAIVVPRQAVGEKDGASVVYRRTASGFEPIPVQLGDGTAGRVAITSGLDEGDVIALRPPTTPTTKSQP